MAEITRTSSPSLSLPKGGGAIRGIGEKFAANPVTGTGSLTVPIATSPGRSGFGPQLSLSYDSGAGNGPFGFGWSLSLPAITRKTDKGLPRYDDVGETDVFLLSGAEDLVPVAAPEDLTAAPGFRIRRYRPRIEGLFARIERWTRVDDPTDVHWRSITGDNLLTLYGKDASSRISDPADPGRVFSWLVCETRDDRGNAVLYRYKAEDATGLDLTRPQERNRGDADDPRRRSNRYIKHILYGNRVPLLEEDGRRPSFLTGPQLQGAGWMFEAVFDYGEHDPDVPSPGEAGDWPVRNDPFSSYRAGFEVRTHRLCQRVLMFHHFPDEPEVLGNCLVRSTDFTYSHEQAPDSARDPVYSFLLSVAHRGYRRRGEGYESRSLPPLEFDYTRPVVQELVEEVADDDLENLPAGLNGGYHWLDLHGEGLPGILTEQGGGWFYKRNLSPINLQEQDGPARSEASFAPVELVTARPNLTLGSGAEFMDLAGDGQPDLVVFDEPVPGLYEHDDAEGWGSFQAFPARLGRAFHDPNLRFVDLDGDGHPDVFITENDAFVWHPSVAEAGFGPALRVPQALDEEKGPRLSFADGEQAVYLADFSGDGLTDLVRVRNGEVCYWPNLGYGRFGAKVTMDNSPWFDHPDQFEQRRLRLADVDGTGTTDLLYLGRDGVRLYFNQSGNGWGAAQTLPVFPQVDNLTDVATVDLLGNGTACLVWSSPLPCDAGRPMRYVNLVGREKPHLLVRAVNNLGAETRVHYAPSTKFYLQNRHDGRPWISRLPFPVHVVERVETFDHVSRSRFVTRYAYHHGHFDGEEREFRGFGLVEQLDTEEFGALSAGGELPAGDNEDATSHVPPVLTRTWFHTGAFVGRDHVSNFFAGLLDEGDTGEYYREPGLTDEQAKALLLDDTVLPAGLTVEEEREASRALKGSLLRQEVYALDGTAKEPHPYAVTEQNFTLRLLQTRGGNPHAVFLAHPRETLVHHYERIPADPRVTHTLTLEVDEFGNVLKAATVAYGRRQADPSLEARDQARQRELHLVYTETRVTNPVEAADEYRTPVLCEMRSYELTGLALQAGRVRFTPEELLDAGPDATELAYEESPSAGVLEKRLIEHERVRYRQNDLAATLPLGRLESLALPFESYKLAFTPGLIEGVYGAKVTDTMLAEEGGYVHSEGDEQWWIPSGRAFHSPDANDTPSLELAFARAHFFLSHRFRDPFGNESTVEYDRDSNGDPYDLFPALIRDPVGNEVQVRHNYRVLQPRLLIDANGNRSEAAFDALGLVVGTAAMGKAGENEGDALDAGFQIDLTQAQIDAFLNDPRGTAASLLADAMTRIVYDLHRYANTAASADPQPVFAATVVRETHRSDLQLGEDSRVQVSFGYSDGFGREVQRKVQAEPGPIEENGPIVDPRWIGSGWTIFNNKGKPVRRFEPFFTDTHAFEFDVRIGVSPVLFYDPTGRVVATLHPNHSWEKIVFDSWRQESWDVNDTALIMDPPADPQSGAFFARLAEADYLPTWHVQREGGALGPDEQAAAAKTAAHAETPSIAHADSLGRIFLTVTHNRFRRGDAPPTEEFYGTRFILDIEGNQREVIDAMDRVVMRYDYGVLSQRIHQASLEAGERWTLTDLAGKPIYAWDSRDHQLRTRYDALQRPSESFLREGTAPELLIMRTVYGDGQPNPEVRNQRGRAVQLFDQAGVVTTDDYDFKGNLLSTHRQLAREYKATLDWRFDVPLESEVYTRSARFDALDRPVSVTAPDSSVYRPIFNEANLLERVEVNLHGEQAATVFVSNIHYDARGQRLRVEHGNNVRTEYAYDPLTFRLSKLTATRLSDQARLQELSYTYDPIGHLTQIQDRAQQTVYFDNQVVAPSSDYVYDATYRLITAEGREHIGQATQPQTTFDDRFRSRLPHPNDGQAMRRYTEQYEYDAVGNFLRLVHQAANGNWTRSYAYDEASLLESSRTSNRLSSTTIGTQNGQPVAEPYTHDAHGNMTGLAHLSLMQWDYQDQLHATSRQSVNNGGTPETTYYVYDAGMQRVRKVTERQAAAGQTPTRRSERIYLSGFEIYREYDSDGDTVTLERETLHIAADRQRVALVETRTHGSDPAPEQLLRYQLGDRLGSASLELDDQARIISYEEYYPYGSTSYQAVRSQSETPKRYRYTGKERDEETGLNYHGARYYSPTLARWISCDPLVIAAGVNCYLYANANPLTFIDPSGNQPEAICVAAEEVTACTAGDDVRKPIGPISGASDFVNRIVQEVDEEADQVSFPDYATEDERQEERRIQELNEENDRRLAEASPTLTISQEGPNAIWWEEVKFAVRRPLVAKMIGQVELGKGNYVTNISTVAARFALRSKLSEGPGEGTEVNALRHVIWQSMTTVTFGVDIAKRAGYSHEHNPYVTSRIPQFDNVRFTTLSLADESADLKNNEIGREIGAEMVREAGLLPYRAHGKTLALKALEYFRYRGLWMAVKQKDGTFKIEKTILSKERYAAAKKNVQDLNEYGFTPQEVPEAEFKAWYRLQEAGNFGRPPM
jgi:RHS repeat-associated protein